jgi:mxaJ protein
MSSLCRRLSAKPWVIPLGFFLAVVATPNSFASEPMPMLRIAADPNNLPFSNQRLEGFENKVAELLARDLQVEIVYVWRAQRRGFFRETLKDGDCSLVLGVPAGFDKTLNTRPYYRSSYVMLYRKDCELALHSLDDPQLGRLRIGVPVVGFEAALTPPAQALASRHFITNVVGYTVFGDYRNPNPPSQLVQAVADGTVDLALVWGPVAGYFTQQNRLPLTVVPLAREGAENENLVFDIAMGVRKGEPQLRDKIDRILEHRKSEIASILDSYGVPQVK